MKLLNRPCLAALLLSGCGSGGGGGSAPPPAVAPPPAPNVSFLDVSDTNLPTGALDGQCMDADHGDGDGDLDLALAQEFATNLVLFNDGSGVFTADTVDGGSGDNEDVRLRDFDGDGDLDMLTVHEDDRNHSVLINDGSGNFAVVASILPINSTANAAEVIDLNGDSRPDILLGNAGNNFVLLQQADGTYVNDTVNRPIGGPVTTQDLLLLDVDGDTDMDLFAANEVGNHLFLNDGNGFFADESSSRLPPDDRESREADAADVDNDGDFDLVVANVSFVFQKPLRNQLLLNDGTGRFSDVSSANLAGVDNASSSFTIRFVDLDSDGDPDVLSPTGGLNGSGGIEAWINDGTGNFSTSAASLFSTEPTGSTFDIEVLDANGDGLDDLYFCYRTGVDQLYLRQ